MLHADGTFILPAHLPSRKTRPSPAVLLAVTLLSLYTLPSSSTTVCLCRLSSRPPQCDCVLYTYCLCCLSSLLSLSLLLLSSSLSVMAAFDRQTLPCWTYELFLPVPCPILFATYNILFCRSWATLQFLPPLCMVVTRSNMVTHILPLSLWWRLFSCVWPPHTCLCYVPLYI